MRLGVGSRPSEVEKYQRETTPIAVPTDLPCERQTVHLRHHHVQYADIEPLARGNEFEGRSRQLGRDRLHPP